MATRAEPDPPTVTLEDEHRVNSFRRYLPEGPTSDGGFRDEPLVQFVSVQGGIRTLAVNDIISIR